MSVSGGLPLMVSVYLPRTIRRAVLPEQLGTVLAK
jgi:hypothetical protein